MSEQPIPAGSAHRAKGPETRMADGQRCASVAPHEEGISATQRTEYLALLGASRSRLWLVAAAVTGDRTEADDVLQDAAMIGLAKFADFAPGSSFDAWMGQITRNVALNALRKRKRAAAALNEQGNAPELRVVSRMNTDDGDEGRHQTPVGKADDLAAAVAGLDDVARTCLLLRVVGGLPYQAISAIVQIPESTAMSHVYRSRGHLRNRLLESEGHGAGKQGAATEGQTKAASPPAAQTGVVR